MLLNYLSSSVPIQEFTGPWHWRETVSDLETWLFGELPFLAPLHLGNLLCDLVHCFPISELQVHCKIGVWTGNIIRLIVGLFFQIQNSLRLNSQELAKKK